MCDNLSSRYAAGFRADLTKDFQKGKTCSRKCAAFATKAITDQEKCTDEWAQQVIDASETLYEVMKEIIF